MKVLFGLLILIQCLVPRAQAVDLSEFGIKQDPNLNAKTKFENLIHKHLTDKMAQFIPRSQFQLHVEADVKDKPKAVNYSRNVNLGMLGTVVTLRGPRVSQSKFVDRVTELRITIFASEGIDQRLLADVKEIALKQLSFLAPQVIKAEVKSLNNSANFFDVMKSYQVLFSALLIAVIIGFGFQNVSNKITNHLVAQSAGPGLGSRGTNYEIIENYENPLLPTLVSSHSVSILSEEHLFMLPLEVHQDVLTFVPFKDIQEIYTLVSPKYKKLFWSCLPKEVKGLPESQLVKQACVVSDVEKTQAWRHYCTEIYKYVQVHPQIIPSLHNEVRAYFDGTSDPYDQVS